MRTTLKKIGKKIYKLPGIHQWMIISCVFSLCLLIVRIAISHRLSYAFLAWNLILASVPFFISGWLNNRPTILKHRIKLFLLIFLWMLFMPNSFYILTDLFHLDNLGNGDSWFDLTLILSFAWNGILFGIISIYKMELLLKRSKGSFISGVVVGAVMWLNAFGVYIGRFLRFNSWDIFLNPFSLLSEICNIFFEPFDHRYVWIMSFCFAFFMITIYYTVKKLGETFKNSW